MKRRLSFDFHAFVRSTILAGFIALLSWMLNTQQLALYINPRFTILTEIACFLLFLMLLAQLVAIIRIGRYTGCAHSTSRQWEYIPFIFILLLAFLVPSNTLNANLVSSKGLNSQLEIVENSKKDMPRPLAAKLKKDASIKVTDHTYTEIISEVQWFPEDYVGKEITVTGFVFKAPGDSSKQFSLVRYVVMCCTADSLPYGILCEIKDTQEYTEGTWLTLSGTIAMTKYEDKLVPAIKVTAYKKIEQPPNPYVFPYEE